MRITMLVASFWLVTTPLQSKIVFYSNRAGNHDIYTMASDGSRVLQITDHPASDSSPAWSPNGQQIAFHTMRDGNLEVYVMDADGNNQRNVTRHPGSDGFPDWHPEGDRIVFDSDRGGNQVNIYVMDTDGVHVEQITQLDFASRPLWSPNGKQIAFEANIDKGRHVYIINADGTKRWQVSKRTIPNASILFDSWSPAGKQILYSESIGFGVNDSFLTIATLHPVMQQKVIKREQVGIPRLALDTPTFSADGTSILFSGKQDNHWNIYRFRLGDRKLTQLTENVNPLADAAPHEWKPRLSVPNQQGVLAQTWGRIKAAAMPK